MQKKEKKRKWIWVIVPIVVLPLIFYIFYPKYITLRQYKEEITKLDRTIKELEGENSFLKKEIRELKHNPLYIERIAREELGMIRPGEKIYRVKEKTETE